ncbi:MAG TPA: TonB-dependent receptor [Candidatus Paceibacterota bacterium]|nr:TonB-dependent receptor [Candidatus Paceibacterota bacterium]
MNLHSLRRIVPFAIPALLALSAAAESSLTELKELSLESLAMVRVDTVVGASKHEEKISQAPANVTILTADDFKFHGWRTLGDALRSVAGIVITYDRSYGFIGVRGFNRPGDYSGRVLITINGHRLNDAIYDTAAVDHDFILDVDLIERIEIIRGPGSTLYGNNAFFGVVNVITRRGADVHGAEVSGSSASFDTFTGRLTYGNRLTNGVEVLLSGSYYDTGGNPNLRYPEFSSVNNGVARNMDDGWAQNVFAQVSWKKLTFDAGYVDRFKRVPTAQYWLPDAEVAFNDRRFRTFDERAFANLTYKDTFGDDWNFMARVYYDHYRYDGFYPQHYNAADPNDPITINTDRDQSESIGGEVQLSKQFFGRHFVTVGSEARYDYDLLIINRDLNPPASYLDAHRSGYFSGVFLQDEFRIHPNLTLTGGARYDHYEIGGDTVNPRCALVYRPWKPSSFKLLYGEAYRAPDANENYYAWPTPPSTLGLKPETVRSYELVYEHEFNATWRASAALFRNELHNLITQVPDGFANLESATAQGFEAGLQANWSSGLQGRASYMYADAWDGTTNERLPNSPEHLAKFNLTVPVWRQKLFASAEVQIMSQRKTLLGEDISGFWVANATLFSRELMPGMEASVSVYNLFNQGYSDPASGDFVQHDIRQDGRSLRVKVTWKF